MIRTILLRILNGVAVEDNANAIENASKNGQTYGRKAAHKESYAAGYAEGKKEGYTQGHKKGYDRGYRDRHENPPGPTSFEEERLYIGADFAITDAIAEQVRADVAQLYPPEKQPTPKQWEMILSPSRVVRVVAGAGSGKSTSLVLRVIVLHVYLGIKLNEITVVTFTNASRNDFADKLTKALRAWGRPAEYDTIRRQNVRTFHSALLEQSKVLSYASVFEQIGTKDEEEGPSNPFASKLNDKQRAFLDDSYHRLYAKDEAFRRYIAQLIAFSLTVKPSEEPERRKHVYDKSLRRDSALVEMTNARWRATRSLPECEGVSWDPVPIPVGADVWWANGRIEKTNTPILLCDRDVFEKDATFDEEFGNFSIRAALWFKLSIMRTYADTRLYVVESEQDLRALLTYVRGDAYEALDSAPNFELALPGEIKRIPIVEAFYHAGDFAENLGLHVEEAMAQASFERDSPELAFGHALQKYWREFRESLHKARMVTYNQLFAALADEEPARTMALWYLQPMQHLLVDEFQDISPQIVRWLRRVHGELRKRNVPASLMVVGDDWQAIYGWRGSNPGFMTDFARHFQSGFTVTMGENFRSGQKIIDAAETLLIPVRKKTDKRCTAARGPKMPDYPVTVIDGDDIKAVKDLIDRIQAAAPSASILVAARSNNVLDSIPVPKSLKQTYHRAKGLEKDIVVLVGDCAIPSTNPFKNELYRIAGFDETFDQAQEDEAYRVGYVAVTRAAFKCYWFIGDGGGASRLLTGNGEIGRDVCDVELEEIEQHAALRKAESKKLAPRTPKPEACRSKDFAAD